MKKIIYILGLLILVNSCSQNSNYTGLWLDKDNEQENFTIIKDGSNYFLEERGKKSLAEINNSTITVSGPKELKGAFTESGNLIINGQEFIKFEKSKTKKYVGFWKQTSTNRFLEIKFNKLGGIEIINLCTDKNYTASLNKDAFIGKVDFNYKRSNKLKLILDEKGILFYDDPMVSDTYEKIENLDKFTQTPEHFIDDETGKKYSVSKIGEQIWMTEDFEISGQSLFNQQESENNAPIGWRLPSKKDWEQLLEFAGGTKDVRDMVGGSTSTSYLEAGNKLKDKESWVDKNGTDNFNFSAKKTKADYDWELVNYATSSDYERSNDPVYLSINSRKTSYLGKEYLGFSSFYRGRSDTKFTVRYIKNKCE